MNHSILTSRQFSKRELEKIFSEAKQMEKILKSGKNSSIMKDKILATLFFEPSTRMRNSFETAMYRLGGNVLSNPDMMNLSSVKKHETLYDTGKIISTFADVIAMRHPEVGSVPELARGSSVPVINAGEGHAEHPTQGILDAYTIQKRFGKLDGLTIGLVGDLKYSRVVHSQCYILSPYKVRFLLVSPNKLRLPAGIKKYLKEKGIPFTETEKLEPAVSKMDVLSDTRIQEERFKTRKEYLRFKGVYCINKRIMKLAKKNMIVISPLPRVDELSPEIDADKRCKYFEQVENGVAVRMALLRTVVSG